MLLVQRLLDFQRFSKTEWKPRTNIEEKLFGAKLLILFLDEIKLCGPQNQVTSLKINLLKVKLN